MCCNINYGSSETELMIIVASFPHPLACSQRSDEKDTENQLEAVQYQRF
jgi:hypothetical protein